MGQEDITVGRINQIKGKANDIAGAITGNTTRQVKGKLQQAVGKAQVALGKATPASRKAARMFALTAVLCVGFGSMACETSRTTSDTPGLFGGNTHEETTTTHNPVTGTNDTTSTETKTP